MSRLIPAALERRYTAAQARVSEVLDRTAIEDADWIAKYRDLVAAWGEMAAVYEEASRLPSVRTGLVWSALFDAEIYARNRRAEVERQLAALEAQDGAS